MPPWVYSVVKTCGLLKLYGISPLNLNLSLSLGFKAAPLEMFLFILSGHNEFREALGTIRQASTHQSQGGLPDQRMILDQP
jgi:hypothetical protein